MSDLINADDLPELGPGRDERWTKRPTWLGRRPDSRLSLYSLDVPVPSIREYLIVAYRNGTTNELNRRSTGDWRSEPVAPGCVLAFSRMRARSHWRWAKT